MTLRWIIEKRTKSNMFCCKNLSSVSVKQQQYLLISRHIISFWLFQMSNERTSQLNKIVVTFTLHLDRRTNSTTILSLKHTQTIHTVMIAFCQL